MSEPYCSLCGGEHSPNDLHACRMRLSGAVGIETRIALNADERERKLRQAMRAALESAENERIDRYRGTDDPREFVSILRRALEETR